MIDIGFGMMLAWGQASDECSQLQKRVAGSLLSRVREAQKLREALAEAESKMAEMQALS